MIEVFSKRAPGMVLVAFCSFAAACFADGFADPLADAVHHFVFDKDINGDGKVQLEELRDVRHWGSTNFNGYAQTSPSATFSENDYGRASWSHVPVMDPSRNVSRTMDALNFRCDMHIVDNGNGTFTTNSQSQRIEYSTGAITGNVTVVARVRVQSFAQPGIYGQGNYAWLVFNGQKWNDDPLLAGGSCFGFIYTTIPGSIATNAYLVTMAGKGTATTSGSTGIHLYTNLWYDIAWTLQNNGDNTATCTFLVRDPGPDKVLGNVKDGRGTRSFRYLEKTMSNVFHNEQQNAGQYLRIGGESHYRNSQGGKAISCDLNRLIMWNRVLTQDELLRVMMKDSTTFRVGVEDGSDGEFGLPEETPAAYDADRAPWREMPKSVSAANPTLTLSFTPRGVDVPKLAHVLRVKAAAGAAGTTTLALAINGNRINPTRTLAAGDEASWDIKSNTFVNAANTITLTRTGGTASSLSFDMLELGGSWTVGKDDGKNSEFSVEGVMPTPCVFYPGDWNFASCQRGMPNSNNNVNQVIFRFWVSEALAKYGYRYSGRVVIQGANDVSAIVSTYGYTQNQWPFAAFLNDEATPRWTTGTVNGVPDNTVYSFDIAPGELNPGWNTIKVKDIGQGIYWCCLDYHHLEIIPRPVGTYVLFR